MHKDIVARYRCDVCPYRKIYWGSVPQKLHGAYLTPGMMYCKGGKKLKAFKAKDPKRYPPSWCPKMKVPAEYRLYDYKDANVWYMYQHLRSMGTQVTPSGPEYAIRAEGCIDLTAHSFWKAIEEASPSDVMGFCFHSGEVLEIDDGLRPYFFYFTECDVRVLGFFDCDAARKNAYKGSRNV